MCGILRYYMPIILNCEAKPENLWGANASPPPHTHTHIPLQLNPDVTIDRLSLLDINWLTVIIPLELVMY